MLEKTQIFSKFTVPGLATLAVQWLGLVASTALIGEPSGMVGEASGKAKKRSYRKFIPNCPGMCTPQIVLESWMGMGYRVFVALGKMNTQGLWFRKDQEF